MRILVAFKVTPDLEALRDADWAGAAERGVETRYVRRILNCFDESALELVLRAADGLAAHRARVTGAPDGVPSIELGAVSVGGREVEPYQKTLVALGYERATRIDPGVAQTGHAGHGQSGHAPTGHGRVGRGIPDTRDTTTDLDFAPAVVAALVARFARDVDHSDVVVLGCRSGPGDGGTVPFRVAEELGWPCLSQVTELEPLADGRLRATCVADGGFLRAATRGPCVLAIGNAVVSSLRAPTLSQRLSHRDEPPDVLPADALGVDVAAACRGQASTLLGLEPIDRSRAGTLIDGPTPQAKTRMLYETHLRARLAKL